MLQGAKDDADARERHRHHLQRSLGVLSTCQWYPSKTDRGDTWVMKTYPKAVELHTAAGSTLYLIAAQDFVTERRSGLLGNIPFNGYKARTVGYSYSIALVPDEENAKFAWHWHPPDPAYTHGHVYVRDETLGDVGNLHLPASRVFFEQVVGFLIVGLGVVPLDPDWRSVIRDVSDRVKSAATWRGDRP